MRAQLITNKALSGLLALAIVAGGATRAAAGQSRGADPVAQARVHYNEGRYEEAVALAAKAKTAPNLRDAANLVSARASLERFRTSGDRAHLDEARAALNEIRPEALQPRERAELIIGLAEALFLEESFGAAAEMFALVMARAGDVSAAARERVLDWWGSALDRRAQEMTGEDRAAGYRRIVQRMEEELSRDPGSAAAGYWLAAAARGMGDLERAWSAAVAGWVRARLTTPSMPTPANGAGLRGDLDRLVTQAIIPDRARQLAPAEPRRSQVADELRGEWQRVKERWK